jgi:hypothetical protein
MMRLALWCAGAVLGAVGVLVVFTGCTLFTRQNARTLLDVVQTACIIEHAMLVDNDVAKVCGVVDALMPDLRVVLASQRKAARRCVP